MTARWSVLLLLGCAAVAQAEYMMPDLEQVPVARLVENLEATLKKRPDDGELIHSLARVHAMAFARALADTDTVRVDKSRPEDGIWLGDDPPLLPFRRDEEPSDEGAREVAARHLARALELYASAEEKAPADFRIRMGYAWCLAQSSRQDEARTRLRALLADAWKKDGDVEYGGLAQFPYVEAGHYLLSLLDPESDADEIEEIKGRVAKLEALPRPVTPIVLPLTEGAVPADLIDPQASVAFDLDGSGRELRWQWITPQAAWLVYDRSGRGQITSALQLFGPRTFNLFHRDGYQALELLDEDGDGWLRGRELRELSLWRDVDQDGVSDPGEVQTLESWGVVGLACRGEEHASGIPWSPRGVELADGTVRPSFDLILERR